MVELRQYTLHDGTRERLIHLFENEFIESQEALGIRVIGPFRDLEDPNRFVWLRGFPDMNERGRMLSAFYEGPVWRAHRDAANATMIDSDNVLLLRPTYGRSANSPVANGLDMGSFGRNALVVANIHYVDRSAIKDFSQGIFARDGKGVPVDKRSAAYHFQIAVLQGGDEAEHRLRYDIDQLNIVFNEDDRAAIASAAHAWYKQHSPAKSFTANRVNEARYFNMDSSPEIVRTFSR